MKKFTKTLLSLVLVFCAIFLTACGGGETKDALDTSVSVNTTGNYTQVEDSQKSATFSSYASADGENAINSENISSYKMSFYAEIPMEVTPGNKTTLIMEMNAIVKLENNLFVGMGAKYSGRLATSSKPLVTGTYYIKDNIMYTTVTSLGETQKIKYALPDVSVGGEGSAEIGAEFGNGEDVSFVEDFTVNDFLKEYTEYLNQAGSTLEICEEANITKLKITAEITDSITETTSTNIAVIVIENGNLKGINVKSNLLGGPTTINIVPFSGNIPYPDLSGYQLMQLGE